MKCPYCNEEGVFDNSNLNHKFKHNGCTHSKYFKVCPSCRTVIAERVVGRYDWSSDVVLADDIFTVDVCPVCKSSWLPDFPTSWTRSITNLEKAIEVIDDVYKLRNIDNDSLLEVQRSHNGIVFNRYRAATRGVNEYLNGAHKRRMSEYLSFLKIAQVLKEDYIDGKKVTSLSSFGELFSQADDSLSQIAFIITMLINIKMTNMYQPLGKESVYRLFNIRFFENILEILIVNEGMNKRTTIYDFGLAVLARNKEQFEKYSIGYSNKFNESGLEAVFFNSSNKELNRAVKSTFISYALSLGLVEKNDNHYSITNFGKAIRVFMKSRPVIWLDQNATDKEAEFELASSILIWRLYKNGLLPVSDIVGGIEPHQRFIERARGISLNQQEDIHFNIQYDEFQSRTNENFTKLILERVKANLADGYDSDEIQGLSDKLAMLWYNQVLELCFAHRTYLDEILNNDLVFSLKSRLQVGMRWHLKVKEMLRNCGLSPQDYKANPKFSGLNIPDLGLYLPGKNIHNPDILANFTTNDGSKCVLVDAKDEVSINNEVPKLLGYNLYCSHCEIDSFCIIALRGYLPRRTKDRILESKESFDRIVIIDEDSLEKLSIAGLTHDEILSAIRPNDVFSHVDNQYLSSLEFFQ